MINPNYDPSSWTEWDLTNINPPTILKREDLKAIILGSCFFASGGGGPLQTALHYMEKIPDKAFDDGKVKIISTDKLENDKLAVVVCDVGSPDAMMKNPDLGNTVPIDAYQELKQNGGIEGEVAYLLPIEIGAINTLVPFYVAAFVDDDLHIINGDPSGRAVPTIGLTLLHTSGEQTVPICPAAVATGLSPKERKQVYKNKNIDPYLLEYAAGTMIKQGGKVGGLACYPVKGELLKTPGNTEIVTDTRNRLIQGTIGLCWEVGKMMLKDQDEKTDHLDFIEQLWKLLKSHNIKSYILIEEATAYPPARGDSTMILDVGKYIMKSGDQELWIYFENENLMAYQPAKETPPDIPPLMALFSAMAPDTISFLTATDDIYPAGTPVSNADVHPCQKYTVLGLAADRRVRNEPMIINFGKTINEILQQIEPGTHEILTYFPIEGLPHPYDRR